MQQTRLPGEKVSATMEIVNTNRVVGGMLSNQLLPRGTADAGGRHYPFQAKRQCWAEPRSYLLAKGITLEVEGDANDFVAKGLSAVKSSSIHPSRASSKRKRTSSPKCVFVWRDQR